MCQFALFKKHFQQKSESKAPRSCREELPGLAEVYVLKRTPVMILQLFLFFPRSACLPWLSISDAPNKDAACSAECCSPLAESMLPLCKIQTPTSAFQEGGSVRPRRVRRIYRDMHRLVPRRLQLYEAAAAAAAAACD